MKLRQLSVEGVGVIRNRVDLDLSGVAVAAVTGANGEGKSTLIVKALDFALFGNVPGDSVTSVINHHFPAAMVSVEFELGGQVYRVHRRRTRQRQRSGPERVSVSVADDSSAQGWRTLNTEADGDAVIERLLGMSGDTAALTWLSHQDQIGAFCQLRPAQRRAALVDAFGLERYGRWAATAKTAAAAAAAKAESLQQQLAADEHALRETYTPTPLAHLSDEDLLQEAKDAERVSLDATTALAADEATVAGARLEQAQAAWDEAVRESYQAARRWDHQRSTIAAQIAAATRDVEAAERRHAQISTALWSQRSSADAVSRAQEGVEQIRGRAEDLQREVARLRAEEEAYARDLQRIEATGRQTTGQLETLQSSITAGQGICLSCRQPLTPEAAEAVLGSQHTQRRRLLAEYGEVVERRTQAQRSIDVCCGSLQRADAELDAARAALSDASTQQARVAAAVAAEPAAAAAVETAATARRRAEELLEGLGSRPELDPDRERSLRRSLEKAQRAAQSGTGSGRHEAQQRRAHAREREHAVWSEQQHRARMRRERASLEPLIARRRQELADVERLAVHLKALQAAFSPAGIPSMILAGVIDELSDDINDVLAAMGDPLGVRVSLDRSRSEERVMFEVVGEDGPVDFAGLGGSEKFRVGLACRIGLSQALARRTGAPVSLLVIDEGWGALDQQYRESVLGMLKDVAAGGVTVLTVTHVPSVRALMPAAIVVERRLGVTQARVCIS